METESAGILFSVVAFLAALTLLVFVHELGHYSVARWFKVKVDIFSIGFGKELFGWDGKNGTRWRISAVPLGGYVKFFGDASGASNADADALDTMSDEDKAISFHHQKRWKKALIVFAGPFVNLAFAALIFAGISYVNGDRIITNEIGAVSDEVEAAGLLPGDIVLEVEGRSVSRFDELLEVTSFYPEQEIELLVDRNGNELTVPVMTGVRLVMDRWDNEHKLGTLAIAPVARDPEVGQLIRDSAAQTFGLQFEDIILAVNSRAVETFSELRDEIVPRPNQEVILTLDRAGDIIDLPLVVGEREVTNEAGEITIEGVLGIFPAYGERVEYTLLEAISEGSKTTVRYLKNFTTTIGQLILGLRSVTELSGPVGMGAIIGDAAAQGWLPYIMIIALISINLGFVNLLPIPMLDGGHLLFYGIEALKGGPLSEGAQNIAIWVGLVFVISLMIFLTLNDLHKMV